MTHHKRNGRTTNRRKPTDANIPTNQVILTETKTPKAIATRKANRVMATALIVARISRRKADIFAWCMVRDANSAVELRPRGVLKQGFKGSIRFLSCRLYNGSAARGPVSK
jgi:hypothetical protein